MKLENSLFSDQCIVLLETQITIIEMNKDYINSIGINNQVMPSALLAVLPINQSMSINIIESIIGHSKFAELKLRFKNAINIDIEKVLLSFVSTVYGQLYPKQDLSNFIETTNVKS